MPGFDKASGLAFNSIVTIYFIVIYTQYPYISIHIVYDVSTKNKKDYLRNERDRKAEKTNRQTDARMWILSKYIQRKRKRE